MATSSELKIGDRVEIVSSKYPEKSGRLGTVRGYSVAHESWAVEMDNYSDGHECGNIVNNKRAGWFFGARDLKLLSSVPTAKPLLSTDATERKQIPLGTGLLDYFPQALIEVAKVSFAGNQQHNPGEPLHWARGKSMDQEDTMLRHFLERGTLDSDGVRHSAKMCWRALAILQLELEAEGYPVARGAK